MRLNRTLATPIDGARGMPKAALRTPVPATRAQLGLLMLLVCSAAAAQLPVTNKPLRVIVPSAPGGAMDTIARLVSAKLGETAGPIVVDNRGGANGAVAAELTAKSPPDGQTVMLGGSGNLAVNPFFTKKPGYDPLKDLAPVTAAGSTGHVMVVHPSVPAKSVKEFIALAKARPGQLAYGTAGTGSSQHLAGWLFQRMAKISLLHVPYKGGPPATVDLVGGQTQLGFLSTSTTAPFVEQGRLRALAVTSEHRSKVFPQLPTLSEAGVPGYEAQQWYGFVAAARTPQPVIARLNREIVQILNLPESRDALLKVGIEVWTSTPEAFGAYMKSEYEKWGRVIREAGIAESGT